MKTNIVTTTKAASAEAVFTVNPNALTDRQIDNRLAKLEALEAEIKSLKAAADDLKQEIINGLPADHHATKRYKVNYSTFSRSTIDSKALKAELPEIAQKYAKTSVQTRFSYSAI